MPSQEERIMDHLKAGGTLTPMDALEQFGCWALSSRVADLNRLGAGIKKTMEKGDNGKRYARYFIPKTEAAPC